MKICEQVVAGGRVDEVFWATCLLLSMLSWTSMRESPRDRHPDLLELATKGVCLLLKSVEWTKFVFLAKYVLVYELGGVGPASIPFLVASFQRIQQGDEFLNDDSYFQSACYRQSTPTKDVKLMQMCLKRLGKLWPEHKSQIVAESGAATLKAMLECSKVTDVVKSDIKQTWRKKTKNVTKVEIKQIVQDATP